jgi:serine/threonine protein kinase
MLPYYSNEQERQEAEKFFLREVQLLAQLKHIGIPQIFDHFIVDDHYYYVMEYVEGETLAEMAKANNGVLPENEMMEYARQIVEVLDCIGNRQEPIIHRDIKPENIIVDKNTRQVKLVDFGLAKAQSNQPMITGDKSSALGTPGYAPPEQYQGKAEPRSDIFALGATTHHMLTGVDPRNASAPFQYDSLAKLNPKLSQFTITTVEQMLNLNLAQRPTAQQLKQIFSGQSPAIGRSPGGIQSPTHLGGLAFNFRSGASARNINELCQLADRYWNDGVYHLYNGDFERWLNAQGMAQHANMAIHIRSNSTSDRNAGLEEFLHQLDPTLPLPTLQVNTDTINLGQVERGGTRTVTLEISNSTRGYLYGAVQSLAPWLKVNPARISIPGGGANGARQVLSIEINTAGLAMGTIHTNGLELHTNGGSVRVNIDMQVSWPPRVKVTPNVLNLGFILEEQRGALLSGQLIIYNDGGSPLIGELRTNTPWLILPPNQQQLNIPSEQNITIQVSANTMVMQSKQISEGSLIIQTPLETVSVLVKAGIKKATFTPSRRALYWIGYILLWLISAALFTYPLAMLARFLQFGFSVNSLVDTIPETIFVPIYEWVDLSLRTTSDTAIISTSVIIAGGLILLGVIAGKLAQAIIKPLDEIELYYSPQLRRGLPAWSFEPNLARYARIGIFLLGIFAVTLSKMISLDWYIRLPFGLALGVLLAFGLLTPPSAGPQHAVRLSFRIQAAFGLIFLRMMMYPSSAMLEAALWGVVGLLLIPNLNSPMPVRWRSIQAHYRPTLLALVLGVLASSLTRWIFYQTDVPFYSRIMAIGDTDLLYTLANAAWVGAALFGTYLAIRMLQPIVSTGQPPFSLRVYWTLLTISSLLVMLAYFIFRLMFVSMPYGNWLLLAMIVTLATFIAVYALNRKATAQYWLVRTLETMGKTSGKLRQLPQQSISGGLTQKATSLPERISQRVQNLIGPAPLDGLTPLTAATAAAITVLIVPILAMIVSSFFALFISMLGFLIAAVIFAWIGYMIWKANKK